MPRHLLVIANETLESPKVLEELRYWADGSGAKVDVVVPMRRRGGVRRCIRVVAAPRLDASGEPQPDRRAVNRAANAIAAYRLAS